MTVSIPTQWGLCSHEGEHQVGDKGDGFSRAREPNGAWRQSKEKREEGEVLPGTSVQRHRVFRKRGELGLAVVAGNTQGKPSCNEQRLKHNCHFTPFK